ncbi:MAG: sulfatase-like hydrolase/transferase, partial [Myxococcales bacterium]|nr:sulfatase-like hydrolase/transferase [Myxococcales bacterium]
SLVPAGAVAGALAGVVLAATAAWAGKRPRAWALSAGVAAVPLAAYLAMHLFSGGSASKLANRGLYEFVAGVLVAAGASVAAVIGLRIATLPSRAGLRAVAALALGGSFALSKIDQWVLPNLYIYLHSLLTVAAWALAAGSVALLSLGFPEARSLKPPGIRVGGAVLLAATALFVAHLASLPHHANARVALVDARASNSQSLMRALEPLFRSGKEDEATRRAAAEARAAREERQAVLARGADLPTWEGAHVLLITVDALRADHIGNYGYARPTSPNLDAFAKTSVVFERAYAQAPHSSYSLSSLMTSEYLHDTLDLGRPPPTETLATALASAGYHTATFFPLGIFHTEGERLKRYRDNAFGFDRHDHRDLAAEPLTDAALAEADRVVADGEPPSFTWVHYFDVHEPYRATHFGTDNMARYDSEILHADKEIRRLIDGFDQRMQRDVVVVISADHGEEFREHGGVYHGSSLYEEQVRIPLLIRAPDLPPRRIGGQVEAVDIAPTILGMTHAKIPASMRGDDLRAVMLGRLPDMGPAFSSVLKMRMGVRWPLKIIADLRFGFFELYDLEKDPGERTNLARADSKDLGVLKGEVYAWLDGLSRAPRRGGDASSSEGDPLLAAIAQGRLWDRRSVTPLSKAVADESVDPSIRREAARILGLLADPMATTALLGALRSKNALVSAEAAIALGRLENPKAHAALRRLAYAEDPDIRARAAVSLARMRDPASVPGLIDALWVTTTTYDREEAVRWLGRMRDERGVEPLIDLIPESRLRHLTVVALGMIGDMRAYQLLV